jgi:hypothetical protein
LQPERFNRIISACSPNGNGPAFVLDVSEQNSSTAHTIKYPQWQREFEAALREGDPRSLRQRVDAAEAALFFRLQALAGSAEAEEERQAISDAREALRTIQRDKLGYPDTNIR